MIDFGVSLRVDSRSSWLRRRVVELIQRDDRDCWVKLTYRRARSVPPEERTLERPGPLMRIRKPVKRFRQVRGAWIGGRLETSD